MKGNNKMTSFNYTIKNINNIHARPLSDLAKIAKDSKCCVIISDSKKNKKDVKKIIGTHYTKLSTFLPHMLCGLRQSFYTLDTLHKKRNLLELYILNICIKRMVIQKIGATPCLQHAERGVQRMVLYTTPGYGTDRRHKRTGIAHNCEAQQISKFKKFIF